MCLTLPEKHPCFSRWKHKERQCKLTKRFFAVETGGALVPWVNEIEMIGEEVWGMVRRPSPEEQAPF